MSKDAIANTYDQIRASGGNGVAISFRAGGGTETRGYHVWRLVNDWEVKTNPNGPWYDHGRKTFSIFGGTSKADALEAAKAWITATYGEHGPWKRNAMGDYLPERIHKAHPIRRRK